MKAEVAIYKFLKWLFTPSEEKPKSINKNDSIIDAPIYPSVTDAPLNEPFRLPHDKIHVFRLIQQWPDGIGSSLFNIVGSYKDGISVSGTSQPEAQENLIRMIYSNHRKVILKRDPNNKYDKNAIEVFGEWENNCIKINGHIGWVNRDDAAEIASIYPDGPIGGKIMTIFQPSKNYRPGIKINIGSPKKKRKKQL